MDNYNVLWIDDELSEKNYSLRAYYEEAEESGIHIDKCSSFDMSDSLLEKSKKYDCIIVDISMPLGTTVHLGESGYGMTAGIVYLQKLLKKDNKTKCFVFSNVETTEIINFCNTNKIPYYAKTKLLPDSFVKHLIKYLSK